MAEVAAAATVLQLIQFSGAVLSGCYDYVSKAQSANREVKKIINDVSGLEGILKRLHVLVSDESSNRHALLKSLARPNGPFDACLRALEDLRNRLAKLTNASSARRKLLWPLEEVRILELLRRLSEQKQTLILALVGGQVIDDDANAQQTRTIGEDIKSMQAKEERSKIIEWLGGTDPSTNYNTARRKHEDGTGEWLLNSEQFRSWKASHGDTMWLSGIPGAGKTILRYTILSSPEHY